MATPQPFRTVEINHSIQLHLIRPKQLQQICAKIITFYREVNINFPFRSKYIPGLDYDKSPLKPQARGRYEEENGQNDHINSLTLGYPLHDFAYRVYISEVISQQTQITRTVTIFNRWMEHFPTLESCFTLIKRDRDLFNQIIATITEGGGFYSRFANVVETLTLLAEKSEPRKQGEEEEQQQQEQFSRSQSQCNNTARTKPSRPLFPDNYTELCQLKGVGSYVGAAVACFAYGLPIPPIDVNVSRVISRLTGVHPGVMICIHPDTIPSLLDIDTLFSAPPTLHSASFPSQPTRRPNGSILVETSDQDHNDILIDNHNIDDYDDHDYDDDEEEVDMVSLHLTKRFKSKQIPSSNRLNTTPLLTASSTVSSTMHSTRSIPSIRPSFIPPLPPIETISTSFKQHEDPTTKFISHFAQMMMFTTILSHSRWVDFDSTTYSPKYLVSELFQGIMDLSREICHDIPKCGSCPVQMHCHSAKIVYGTIDDEIKSEHNDTTDRLQSQNPPPKKPFISDYCLDIEEIVSWNTIDDYLDRSKRQQAQHTKARLAALKTYQQQQQQQQQHKSTPTTLYNLSIDELDNFIQHSPNNLFPLSKQESPLDIFQFMTSNQQELFHYQSSQQISNSTTNTITTTTASVTPPSHQISPLQHLPNRLMIQFIHQFYQYYSQHSHPTDPNRRVSPPSLGSNDSNTTQRYILSSSTTKCNLCAPHIAILPRACHLLPSTIPRQYLFPPQHNPFDPLNPSSSINWPSLIPNHY